MGKRKLRFDNRKNHERHQRLHKKLLQHHKSNHLAALVVNLPLKSFLSSDAQDLTQLYNQLRRNRNLLLSDKWRVSIAMTDEEIHAVTLSQVLDGYELPILLILCRNLTWSLSLGIHGIPNQHLPALLQAIPNKINNIASLINAIHVLQRLHVCVGNPDPKFEETRLYHNGIFKSKDSKFIMMFDNFI